MTRVTLPFGDWRPDMALLNNQLVGTAENVYPGANAYFPVPALSFQNASAIPTGNDGYTKFMLYFPGADASTTFTDQAMGATDTRTWTAVGNVQIDTADSKFGGSSGLFDGNGDYITTPDSSDFSLGSGEWTFSCWFKCNVAGGTEQLIAGQCDSSATTSTLSIGVKRTTGNVIQAFAASGSSATSITGTTQFTDAVNTGWHFLLFRRTGNTLQLWIDATQEGGDTSFSSSINNSSNKWGIGTWGEVAASTQAWKGWFDDVRLDVGVARSTTLPTASPDQVRGLFMAKATDGTNVFFAGTVIKLYKWKHSTGTWADVSRSSGGDYVLAAHDLWSFAQFGANVYATHVNDVLQSIDATSGTNFAAVSGSPPQAGHVHALKDRLVLSGLSSDKKAIHWSATEDPTGWTIGTSLSDSQTFPDAGDALGVVGDTTGIVVMERALYSMQFLPGDTDRIFSFSKVESERGATGKLAFVYTNNTLFFRGADGFFAWNGSIQPIGHDAVDIFHRNNFVTSRDNEMVVFAAPDGPHIWFSFYRSTSSVTYDHSFIYDYAINKWSYCTEDAQMWAMLAQSDKVKKVGAVDTSGRFSLLVGTNLAAVIDTAESNLNPGMRTFVTGAYPLIDASTSLGSVALTVTPYTREIFTSQPAAGTACSIESNGWAAPLSSSRLHKFRVNIPAGQWTQAQGIVIDHQPDGEA